MGIGKILVFAAGSLAGIPIAWKLGTWVHDQIMKKAQSPEDIVDQETCKVNGYHWYDGECHAEPEEKPVIRYCCQVPGHENVCFDTYEELIAHYDAVHPDLIKPPTTPTLIPPRPLGERGMRAGGI